MSNLIREPVRSYGLVLFIVLAGMLLETAAAIAKPQPLKTILDNVASSHHLPKWLIDFVGPLPGGTSKIGIAALAALLLVAIAVFNALAHRLRPTRRTDRVIEITEGIVTEEGTSDELNQAPYETSAALAA